MDRALPELDGCKRMAENKKITITGLCHTHTPMRG